MFQQITLIGHLGSDPEMRYTPSGLPVSNFNLAVNKQRTSTDGQAQEKTTWFRITLWERQAEVVNQYLHKGSQVMVIGEIESARPWTDRDGNLRASIEVTGRQVKFLGGRTNNSNGAQEALEAAGPSEEAPDGKGEIPF